MKPRRDFVAALEKPDWAEHELGRSRLGDRRLDKRLIALATERAKRPGAPVSQACTEEGAFEAGYRFLENDFVRADQMLVGHYLATRDRLAREALVLIPSDTTSYNFSHLPQTTGLGRIGSRDCPGLQGLWQHSSLAFTPKGLPLGLVAVELWSRPAPPPGGRDPHQFPFEEKESVRWRQSWQACQNLAAQLPTSTLLVNITDQEGDIYEVLSTVLAQAAPRAHLLVRAYHNRQVEGQPVRLWEHLAKQPLAGTLEVRVPRQGKQKARIATLQIRFHQVELEAPLGKPEQPTLTVWAIEAREIHAPSQVEPILWRLLSTLPVTTAEEAIEKVRWYAVRWGIEVFHRIAKSVCGAEAHQFETRERLERMLMLDLLLAWRLLVLTLVGRENPDLLASDYFAQSEWKALYSYINKTRTVPEQAPTLGQMTQWLGRLGGFVKCKATPHPGSITLTRGLERLEDLTTMWRIQNPSPAKRV